MLVPKRTATRRSYHPIVLRSRAVNRPRSRRNPVVSSLLALMAGALITGGVQVLGPQAVTPLATETRGTEERGAGNTSSGTTLRDGATDTVRPDPVERPSAVPTPSPTESLDTASDTSTEEPGGPGTPTTAPSPDATPPPSPTTTNSPAERAGTAALPDATREVIDLVNQARTRAGCSTLTPDRRLDAAAAGHSRDMAERNYFSHTSPEGETFADRARRAGYPRPGGENIARGQRSAEQVMTAWMGSPGHRANILNCRFTTIGVGLDTRGWYWTQVFGW